MSVFAVLLTLKSILKILRKVIFLQVINDPQVVNVLTVFGQKTIPHFRILCEQIMQFLILLPLILEVPRVEYFIFHEGDALIGLRFHFRIVEFGRENTSDMLIFFIEELLLSVPCHLAHKFLNVFFDFSGS